MKKDIPLQEQRFFYIRKTGRLLLIAPVIISGLAYVILQWSLTGQIVDTLFVGLLFGASVILVFGIYMLGSHLIMKSPAFFLAAFEDQKKMDAAKIHADFLQLIFDTKKMTITGILYGLLLAGSPIVLELWSENGILLFNLSIFLFFVNFITGAALYSLVRFIEKMYRITPFIHIDLWQANSDKTDFLLGMTRKMTVIASIYISLCMISILFSKFPINVMILSYAAFSGLIFLTILIVTPAPVMKKLKQAKMEALTELDLRIQELFSVGSKENDQLGNSEELTKLRNLFELREKIEQMNTFPFKVKSILAALSVIFFSALPVIVRTILDLFFG